MKEESKKLISATVNAWKARKIYTYQFKEVSFGKSPVQTGEFILKFTITLKGFHCQGKEIPISLNSKAFHTTTLSDSPLSENVNADAYRLEKLLKDLDEQFDSLVSDKFSECQDVIFSTDPLFF